MNGNRKDLTGQRFGRLVVIEPVTTGKYCNSVWLCQCDCGNKKIVPTYKLLNGRTYSCGCYRKQSKQVIEELAKVKTEIERLKEENRGLKQALEKIEEFVSLDDVNCTISAETLNVCNDVKRILREVLK